MKKVVIPIAVIGVVGALAGGVLLRRSSGDGNSVRVSGNIEVTELELSFKIPGRVEQRFLDEGQGVEKGACVAVLETADLAAEAAMREAELRAAESNLADLESGSRPSEIDAAKARLVSAMADRDRLESEFRSAQQLLQNKVISDEEFTHRKGVFEAAAARVREAAEQLKLTEEGPRRDQVSLARAKVEQAKAALELAQIRLGYAKITSPVSGVVLSKNVEPGEYVAPGTPVVTVGEIEKPWLRAYVNETDLGRVKLGQEVRIKTDTFPDKRYEGKISFIASQGEFTPRNVQTEKERVKLVYRIKVDIPNPRHELKPGMPADAEILLGDGPSLHAGH